MINLSLSLKSMTACAARAQVYFFGMDAAFDAQKSELKKVYPLIDDVFKQQEFTGAAGSMVVIPADVAGTMTYLICVGLGYKNTAIKIETYRRALGSLIRQAERLHFTSLAIELPKPAWFDVDAQYLARETALTLHLAAYHFDKYITDEKKKFTQSVSICLVAPGDESAYKQGLDTGELIAKATNQARWWVDTPPSEFHPSEFAKNAEAIAKKQGLKITVFSEDEVRAMGMGGLAGVSAGSEQDCKLIIMEYRCGDDKASHIGLVGKGITFDSGGLSLKPAASMESMKEDMAGAAAVVSTMDVISQLKPHVNVTAVIPVSENLPSGKATKPGDILTFYNGKTAEVRNTDAEGRLILADALSYAVKHYKLDALFDLATLTGACAYALGPFFAGMMSKDEALMKRLEKAAATSGDRVWELPFDDDYKVAIKSQVADICNIGSSTYKAGAVTAGFFLSYFTGDVPWVHLDIAGVAYDVPDMSYLRPGATGYGVRLLTDLITQW